MSRDEQVAASPFELYDRGTGRATDSGYDTRERAEAALDRIWKCGGDPGHHLGIRLVSEGRSST